MGSFLLQWKLQLEMQNLGESFIISFRINVSTYPSPNPKLTLSCYQLTVVGLREGLGVCSCSDTDTDLSHH